MKTRLLFIENDTETFYVLNHILKNNGYDVKGLLTFGDIESIFSFKPSLILLDEWLDNITGNEICMLIKAHPDGKNIPVILISAVPNLESIAVKCNADGFIDKPFELDYLLQCIDKALKKADWQSSR